MAREVFQSLWVGRKLSVMEQLSIRSFLANGYEFHLYTYQDLEDIPPGTTVRAGEEILPADQIFCYQKGYGRGSYAAFANGFRYKLLLERGGWWTDLDSVCMQPIDLADEHILGKERSRNGGFQVACGMVKAPAGSPLMRYCWEASQRVDRAELLWGKSVRLMTEAGTTGGAGSNFRAGGVLPYRLLADMAIDFGQADSQRLLCDSPLEFLLAARAPGP